MDESKNNAVEVYKAWPSECDHSLLLIVNVSQVRVGFGRKRIYPES